MALRLQLFRAQRIGNRKIALQIEKILFLLGHGTTLLPPG
jgi:hypothetical protein